MKYPNQIKEIRSALSLSNKSAIPFKELPKTLRVIQIAFLAVLLSSIVLFIGVMANQFLPNPVDWLYSETALWIIIVPIAIAYLTVTPSFFMRHYTAIRSAIQYKHSLEGMRDALYSSMCNWVNSDGTGLDQCNVDVKAIQHFWKHYPQSEEDWNNFVVCTIKVLHLPDVKRTKEVYRIRKLVAQINKLDPVAEF
jgi:hypothetical protein